MLFLIAGIFAKTRHDDGIVAYPCTTVSGRWPSSTPDGQARNELLGGNPWEEWEWRDLPSTFVYLVWMSINFQSQIFALTVILIMWHKMTSAWIITRRLPKWTSTNHPTANTKWRFGEQWFFCILVLVLFGVFTAGVNWSDHHESSSTSYTWKSSSTSYTWTRPADPALGQGGSSPLPYFMEWGL